MYLYIFCKKHYSKNLLMHYKKYGIEDNDLVSLSVDDRYTSIYIARNALSDKAGIDIFRGYFIDDEKRKIVLSGNHDKVCPAPFMPLRGSFFCVKTNQSAIYVKNDVFSMRPIFYFSNSDLCIISGSILLIANAKKALGLKNRLNEEVAISMAWVNGKGAQLINFETIIDDIYFAPLNSTLIISWVNGKLALECKDTEADLTFTKSKSSDDYAEIVRKCADRFYGVCAGLALQKGLNLLLPLSGGLDSRCCLAALASFLGSNKILITSSRNAKDDYATVQKLAQIYGFSLNQRYDKCAQSGSPLTRWSIANAAKYHVLCDNTLSLQENIIRVSGHGAECIKGDFGWKSLCDLYPAMADNSTFLNKEDKAYLKQKKFWQHCLNFTGIFSAMIAKERGKIIYALQRKALARLNIDPASKNVSEYLYTYLRNPCHAGHASYNSYQLFPFMDTELVGLAHSKGCNPWLYPGINSPSIVTDLLICLDPSLAMEPFSNHDFALTAAPIQERQKLLGIMFFLDPYKVIGKTTDAASGISETFLKIAEEMGFKGSLDYSNWLSLALKGYEILPSAVRKHFDIHNWILRNDFPEKPSQHKWKWHIAGKFMAFLLVN